MKSKIIALRKTIKMLKRIIAKEDWQITVDDVIENYLKPAIKIAKARGNLKIPETKYKSFKEIEKVLQRRKKDLLKVKKIKPVESLVPVAPINIPLPDYRDDLWDIIEYVKEAIDILRGITKPNDIVYDAITNLIFLRNSLEV